MRSFFFNNYRASLHTTGEASNKSWAALPEKRGRRFQKYAGRAFETGEDSSIHFIKGLVKRTNSIPSEVCALSNLKDTKNATSLPKFEQRKKTKELTLSEL